MVIIATLASTTDGLSFTSLPLKLRNVVYKNLLIAFHCLECRYLGTFDTTRHENMHVVENLRSLKFGALPLFDFTLEARFIFVRHNTFQINQYELYVSLL